MKKIQHNVFYRSRKTRNRKNPEIKEYYKALITERFKKDLIEGPSDEGSSPTRFTLIKYREDGKVFYYPLRLLFRTTAEQIINGIVTGQLVPSDETFNSMYDRINELFPDEYIDWFRRDTAVIQDNPNNQIYNERVMTCAGKLMFFPKVDGEYDKEKFVSLLPRETLGNIFTIASQLPIGEDRDVWLKAAKTLANRIVEVYGVKDTVTFYDDDFFLHEEN